MTATTNQLPHIVLILADNLGWGELGCYGGGVLRGRQVHSNREGFVCFIKEELRAVKWRNWKMHIVWEPDANEGPIRLETPYLFNLMQDPKEETDLNATGAGWVRGPIRKMILDFLASLEASPPIPPGVPDDYIPRCGSS